MNIRRQLAERLTNIKVGPASDPTSDRGPLIDKANVARVNQMVKDANCHRRQAHRAWGPVSEVGGRIEPMTRST